MMTGYLQVQKLVNGEWVTTAKAQDLEAAARHADAVGGQVRVLSKINGDVIAMFTEEDEADVFCDIFTLLGAYSQKELGAA